MGRDVELSSADIELLREACKARSGMIQVEPSHGDLHARFARTVSPSHLVRLGYLEAAGAEAWRIKPPLCPGGGGAAGLAAQIAMIEVRP